MAKICVCLCLRVVDDKMPCLSYDWKSRFKERSWFGGQWVFTNKPVKLLPG